MNRQTWLLVLLVFVAAPVFAQDKGYDVKKYWATIHLDRQRDSIWGEVEMTAKATRETTIAGQFLKYLTIDNILVNGDVCGPRVLDTLTGEYEIRNFSGTQRWVQTGETFVVRTKYHGNPRPEQTGGNWGGVTVKDSMMFAMGVGLNAPYTSTTRHWLPCYDLPDDKADTVDLYFWTDSNEVVAGNGIGDVSYFNGQRLTHWFESKPISTYLLTFAVGPYTTTSYFGTTGPGGEMFALARDSVAANNLFADIIAPSVAFYDSLFRPYPFEKVGYVVTPIGSMEHQTMICLDKHALGDTWGNTTPSHELAHQWWGDWVTCKTFDDAWLNEGFATYCESLIHERFQGHDAYIAAQVSNRKAEVNVVNGKMRIDSLPIYSAATADHHTNNYPATIYKKGAVVLGMLRSYFGDPFFFAAIRSYGNTHAYSTVTTADLQQMFETMSGQKLGWFFQEFVYDRGAPVVDVSYHITGNHVSLDLTQVQDSLGYRYFRVPLTIRTQKSGIEDQTIWLDSMKTTHIELDPSSADTLIIDPDQTALIATRFVRITSAVFSAAARHATIRVYPNPSTGEFNVAVTSDEPMHWTSADVFDTRGVRCRGIALDTTARELSQTISTQGLAAGAYTLIVSTAAGDQFVQRLTVR